MTIRAFIDANIIIDLLADRAPFADAAACLFEAIRSRSLRGFTSANCLANIHYVLSHVSRQRTIRQKIAGVRRLLDIVPTDAAIIDRALASDLDDFEDAIQYYSAMAREAGYIVTRDPSGFAKSAIRVVDAEELNGIIDRQRESKRPE
ncbi:MAG: PIN domain-containing protein [Planctomycetota bacterium]